MRHGAGGPQPLLGGGNRRGRGVCDPRADHAALPGRLRAARAPRAMDGVSTGWRGARGGSADRRARTGAAALFRRPHFLAGDVAADAHRVLLGLDVAAGDDRAAPGDLRRTMRRLRAALAEARPRAARVAAGTAGARHPLDAALLDAARSGGMEPDPAVAAHARAAICNAGDAEIGRA